MGEIILSICVGLCLVIAGVQVLKSAKRDEQIIRAYNEKNNVREGA